MHDLPALISGPTAYGSLTSDTKPRGGREFSKKLPDLALAETTKGDQNLIDVIGSESLLDLVYLFVA